jgi:hypothetical protein
MRVLGTSRLEIPSIRAFKLTLSFIRQFKTPQRDSDAYKPNIYLNYTKLKRLLEICRSFSRKRFTSLERAGNHMQDVVERKVTRVRAFRIICTGNPDCQASPVGKGQTSWMLQKWQICTKNS